MDLIRQLSFGSEDSKETQMVRQMKEALLAHPEPRGDKLTANFKISRDRHGKLLAAVARHDMTITDVITAFIDQVIPLLQQARPIEVPGWKTDRRTKAAIRLREIRKQEKARYTDGRR